jgi:hypothetical protein
MRSYHGQHLHNALPSASDPKALNFLPAFKNQRSCGQPELLAFEILIPLPIWYRIFPCLHKLHLTANGRPVWPMKIQPIILLLGITAMSVLLLPIALRPFQFALAFPYN